MGVERADAANAAKRAADPGAGAFQLREYVGFAEAKAEDIRGSARRGVRTTPEMLACVAGVFDVEHLPEQGEYSHCHIVMLPTFLDGLREQEILDGPPAGEPLTARKGRVHAVHMITRLFEARLATLFPAPEQAQKGEEHSF